VTTSLPRSREERAFTLRLISLFEGLKGSLALAAAFGLLVLTPDDVQGMAERLVTSLGLNPEGHYSTAVLDFAGRATPQWMHWVAIGAIVYAGFRGAEGIGLWLDKAWAEWLGVVTGLIYVPFEAYAFVHKPGLDPVLALLINIGIVLYLGRRLKHRGKLHLPRARA
jgi:uncharacterized membrane protein (DUF2068 family)